MSALLRTTSENDFVPLSSRGQPVNVLWADLRDYLETRLGPEGADLLAEPVMGARGQTDWYGPNDARPSQADSSQDKAALAARLKALEHELATLPRNASTAERQLAALLPLALTVPDESCLFSGPNGPVLVAWGNRPVTEKLERKDITARGGAVLPEALSPAPEKADDKNLGDKKPAARVLPPLPPTQTFSARRPLGPWAPWLLRLFLLALGAFLLWRAPLLRSWLNPLLCRWPHLLFWLVLLLLLVALVALLVPLVLRWVRGADLRRAARAGAQRGVLQIVLAWDDGNDLDLNVVCPNGQRLSFADPAVAGGQLDVPPAQLASSGPVESASWEVAPPPGLYTVLVDPAVMNARPATPYRITVRLDGRIVLRCNGIARAGQRCMPACSFVLPA